MFRFRRQADSSDLLTSKLFSHETFYEAFIRDLRYSSDEVVIESPFITLSRTESLLPLLQKVTKRGVRITVNTKDPLDHDMPFSIHAKEAISMLRSIGVQVLFTGGHHRKIAVIDRQVLWEGSLNILSQNDSCEIMRRTRSKQLASEMVHFLGLEKFLR